MASEIQEKWYYDIELAPGRMSGGHPHPSTAMVRRIIANADLTGTRCLDIGAQEGLMSVLMARQGAAHVAAYDRLNLSPRLAAVEAAYDVRIDYFHSLQLAELPAAMTARGQRPFDVVVFAGVLYHMIDPLAGLAIARSFLRQGGLAVLETSVILSDDHVAYFNAGGRYYPYSNYFQISLACYDYFVRMLRLKPIDLLFTPASAKNIARVSLVCRAIDHVVAEAGDAWIDKPWIVQDMAAVGLDHARLASAAAPVGYRPLNPDLVCFEGSDCVDVKRSIKLSQPIRHREEDCTLHLQDQA